MIKIINKKTEEINKIYHTTCDDCGAELECTKDDAYVGAWGSYFIKCPVCGTEVMLDEVEPVELTVNNIEFPKHFSKTSNGAIKLKDEKIQEYVKECLQGLKNSDNGEYQLLGSGDTVVIVFKYEDEYQIYVARSYYESSIPR